MKIKNEYEYIAKIIEQKIYQKDIETQKRLLQQTLNEILKLYGVNKNIEIIFEPNPILYLVTGGGAYDKKTHKLYLFKLSLVTFLHEIAHILITENKIDIILNDIEDTAQVYALQIFKLASPALFDKAIKNKRVLFKPIYLEFIL